MSYKVEAVSEQKAVSYKLEAVSGVAGKHQPYSEYKESGVKWLGEIPVSWTMNKLSHAYDSIGSGTTPPSTEEKWYQGDIPWVTTGELRESVIYETSKCVSGEALTQFSVLRTYPAGSIVMAMYGATIGRVGILGVSATTNQACCVFPESKILNNKYLYYWLQAFREDIIRLSSGGGQPNINQEKVASLKVSAPSSEHQRTIAAFLDYETARIDALIAKQQRLIELLKEKRQAVISHAVTKGLNPNVPMKDSGVEWLGQVPAHWEVCRLKHHIISMEQGWSPQCEARLAEEGEYGVLKVGCVNGGVFRPQEHKALPGTISPKKEYSLKKGQLLISRANTRELVGSAAVVDQDYSNLLLCDKLYRLKFSEEVQPEFISYLLGSPLYRSQIELSASGASDSMQNIGQSSIRELPVALPPLKEVVDILSHMSSSLIKFNMLHEQLETQALLLSERRTALISAAVTGKIDVRGWQPPAEAEHAYS
ncbi:restriction endonuclease subunit S [Oceanimonas sp. AH20CE76]|uniref:restriction endonuclease subunit S n=1 Tax=Oceanimonas sp. AH20CE76 TaxID=2977120 RepID=UPI0031FE83E8